MASRPKPEPEASELHHDRVKRAVKARTRVEAVRQTGLFQSAHTIPALNRAVRITARALKTPVAQINLISDTTSLPIAAHSDPGEDAELWRAPRQAGKSFCKHILWSKAPFLVQNASEDPLVRHSRAARDFGVQSYLGVPVHAPVAGGRRQAIVGTVCVVDHEPRTWTDDDVLTLSDMALGVSDFIAARMRATPDMRRADQDFSRTLDAVGAAVLSVDMGGVVTYANNTASRLLGYSIDELVGHSRHELIHHSRPDGSRYLESECPISHARDRGIALHESNDVVWRSDGSPVNVDATVTPLLDRGEVVGAVLTLVDVARHRAAEDTERDARRAAEASSRAKTNLLRSVSEELRAPLEEIGLQSVQLERTLADVDAEQLADVRAIQRSHARLMGVVDNLAGFADMGDDGLRGAR